jgi:hypothetical protein
MVRNWGCGRAVLEVLITERRPTKREWRACDRYGTIMGQVQGPLGAVSAVVYPLVSVIARRQFPRSDNDIKIAEELEAMIDG